MIGRVLLRGLLALLPAALTIYVLYYVIAWLNRVTNAVIGSLWPDMPEIPGLGIAVGLVLIFSFGLLVTARATRHLLMLLEMPLRRVPLIKTLYNALSALANYLAPSASRRTGEAVAVLIPGTPIRVVGFVMRDDLTGLPEPIGMPGAVAVYLPMSYQIGGYTVFVPREWIQPLNIGVEAAMREALTGWIGGEPPKPVAPGPVEAPLPESESRSP